MIRGPFPCRLRKQLKTTTCVWGFHAMCIMEIRVCEFYDEQVGGLKFTLLGQGTKQNKTLSNFTKGFHTLLN